MSALLPTSIQRLKDVFDQHRSEWLRTHPLEWVVLDKSGSVVGFYPEYGEAVSAAAKHCGADDFLLQQVLQEERVENIQHVFLN